MDMPITAATPVATAPALRPLRGHADSLPATAEDRARLRMMLTMQDRLNRTSNKTADWVRLRRAWFRAIWTECAELMGHGADWEWWKHRKVDLDQARLELIDILHFALSGIQFSDVGLEDPLYDPYAGVLAAITPVPADTDFICEQTEELVLVCIQNRGVGLDAFRRLAVVAGAVGLDYPALFRLYIGKNALNAHRQDNGYRDGSYLKRWHGQEDNHTLYRLALAAETCPTEGLYDHLRAQLAAEYQTVLADAGRAAGA